MPDSPPILVQISRGGHSDMDWLQLADCLWLEQHRERVFFRTEPDLIKSESARDPSRSSWNDEEKENHQERDHKPVIQGVSKTRSQEPAEPQVRKKQDVPLIPDHGSYMDTGGQPAGNLRIRKLITFPDSQEMARALRPLHRRVATGPRDELDVEATVELTASCGGVFQPVFRAARQRWISVDLVVDDSASMEFWSDLPRDTEALLKGSGVFRDVRRWMLDTRSSTPLLMSSEGAVQNSEILNAFQKDRVVILLTDTIGPAWHNASLVGILENWAQRRSVAFVHILPPEQWAHTALWRTEPMRLASKSAVSRNVSQTLRADFPLSFRPPPRRVPFPALSLDADGFGKWADLLSARGSNAIRGFQFCPFDPASPPPSAPTAAESLAHPTQAPHDAGARLTEFLSHAPSPLVVELATLLAAAPLIPEVMRIIQEAFLPQTRHWHLSAIVFSGLARRSRLAEGRNWYEWLPGVQQQLLSLGSSRTQLEIWHTAAHWLMEHEPLYRSFQGLYPHPGGKLTGSFANEAHYFALFESTLFKTWKGEWREHGEELERGIPCGRAIVTLPVEGFDGRPIPKVRVVEGKICVDGRIRVNREGQHLGEALIEKLISEEAAFENLEAELAASDLLDGVVEGEYGLLLSPDLKLTFNDEITCWPPESKPLHKPPRLLLLCDNAFDHGVWKYSGLRELLSKHFTLDDGIYHRVTVDMSRYDAAVLMVAKPELETEESPRKALLRERKRRVFPVALISRTTVEVQQVAQGLPSPIVISGMVTAEHEDRLMAALGSRSVTPNISQKLEILFLAANPTDGTRRAIEGEHREIQERIHASEHRSILETHVKGTVWPHDLLQHLQRHKPHAVHFSGRGGQSEELVFLDDQDKARPVTKEALQHLFRTLRGNIRVVVLNACFSRPQAEAITEVIDCAVGIGDSIGDEAAILFAAAFYQAIGFGKSVQTAFDLGISATLMEGIQEDHVPVLLTRAGVDPATVFLISQNPLDNPDGKPAGKICNLPASIGSLFKGREEFLERLHREFRNGSGVKAAAITAAQTVHGLGGIGKTRAAIEYAHRYQREYSALLMVRADSAQAFHTNLAELAHPSVLNLPKRKDPEEESRFETVLRWLGHHPGWLLIIDNADTEEAAAAVEKLLGRLASGHVLITSRLETWSPQVRGFDLQTLMEEDAVNFLLERTAKRRQRKASDVEDAAALAARLDGLALALEQAGAHIAERRISFDHYLNLVNAHREEVLKWHNHRLMRYPASVAATWLISFEQLGTVARDLLDSLSFLAPDPIPRSMIEKAEDGQELGEALAELSRYSLIRFLEEPPDTFSVHRLVQEIVRSRIGDNEQEVWERTVDWLVREAPKDSQNAATWNAWRQLAPHCTAVITGIVSQYISWPAVQLMNDYAAFLMSANADYTVAEPLFRRALEARERFLEPGHPDTLTSLNNLALLLRVQGNHAGAETLYRRALEGQERVLGPEHPDTLNTLNNLAVLLRAKGDYAEAEKLYRHALEGQERVLGSEHPDTLASLSNFAQLLHAKGGRTGAEALSRRALEARERVLGAEHPDTLHSLSNLAVMLESRGDHAGAEPLYRRALEMREQVLGLEHPDTLISLNNLAGLLHAKGDYAGAEPLLRQALEGHGNGRPAL